MEQKSSNTPKILLAISLIVNVALVILLVMLNTKSNEQEAQIDNLTGVVSSKDSEIVSKTKVLESMALDLERIREERAQLGLQNDSLDNQISKLNSFITQLKKSSKLDANKRRELEQMITQLRKEITAKDTEIALLKTENDSLVSNLNYMTTEKLKLGDSLSLTAQELAYAGILKADGIKVIAIKSNGKELDQEEYKQSKIDRIKISFGIADNKAAKKNKKRFYVSIVPPSGEIFSDINNGGGTTMLHDGTEVFYSLSQDLVFENTNQKLDFLLPKGFNYVKGNYNIIVYSEGYKIGEGSFIVK